jgi:hypothetical protein
MPTLDDLKGKTVRVNGITYPDRKILEIIASGSSASDDSVNNRTILSLTGVGSTYILPQSYGAIGDGVTDDSTAVQSAVTAAVAAGSAVFFPSGVYRCTATIAVAGKVDIAGAGWSSVVFNDGSNKDVFYVTGDDVTFRNLTIRGNQTGAGASGVTGGAGGNGVKISEAFGASIANCRFEGIGLPAPSATFAACVAGHKAGRIQVSECFFDSDNRSETGADVSFVSAVAETTVSGCVSISDHDSFAAYGSYVYTETGVDVVKHTVSGCVAVRAVGSDASHGVFAGHGLPVSVTVTGNVFEGFALTGVYVNPGSSSGVTEENGGATVNGNVIRYCGGGSDTLTGGVHFASKNGGSCSGNWIYRCGYQLDESSRTYASTAPGIKVIEDTKSCTFVGNTIVESAGYGIMIATAGGSFLCDLIFEANTILDCEADQIYLVTNTPSYIVQRIKFTNNTVTHSADTHGLRLDNSSNALYQRIDIVGNTLTYTGGAASTKYALNFKYAGVLAAGEFNGKIKDNTFDGYLRGLSGSTWADRAAPTYVQVEGNFYKNCDTGVLMPGLNNIAYNPTFDNCVTPIWNFNFSGRQLGADSTGAALVEVDGAATPTSGSWLVGDRVRFTAPTAAGYIGAVCTIAGAPGTWKTYGIISA